MKNFGRIALLVLLLPFVAAGGPIASEVLYKCSMIGKVQKTCCCPKAAVDEDAQAEAQDAAPAINEESCCKRLSVEAPQLPTGAVASAQAPAPPVAVLEVLPVPALVPPVVIARHWVVHEPIGPPLLELERSLLI